MPPTQRRIKKESNFAYAQCKSIRFANIETYHKFIKRKFSKTGNFLFFRKKKVSRKRKYFDKNKRGILYKKYIFATRYPPTSGQGLSHKRIRRNH